MTNHPQNKKEKWEEDVYRACFNAEMGADMVRFIRQLLKAEREETYQKGFNDGADSTGGQAQEIMAEKIQEAIKAERERVRERIEEKRATFLHNSENEKEGCVGHFSTQDKTDGYNLAIDNIIKILEEE